MHKTTPNCTMQEKSEEKCSPVQRLDKLRVTLQLNWSEIAAKVGLSESMLYQVKAGKKNLSDKAIYRLEQAERSAGLAPAFQEQVQSASGPEKARLLESATRKELFSVLPPEAQKLLMEGDLEKIHHRIADFINDSEALSLLAEEYLKNPRGKNARENLLQAAEQIQATYSPARELWDEIYKSLRARFLG